MEHTQQPIRQSTVALVVLTLYPNRIARRRNVDDDAQALNPHKFPKKASQSAQSGKGSSACDDLSTTGERFRSISVREQKTFLGVVGGQWSVLLLGKVRTGVDVRQWPLTTGHFVNRSQQLRRLRRTYPVGCLSSEMADHREHELRHGHLASAYRDGPADLLWRAP